MISEGGFTKEVGPEDADAGVARFQEAFVLLIACWFLSIRFPSRICTR